MSGSCSNAPPGGGVTVGLGWLDGTAATPMPDGIIGTLEERFGERVVDLPPSGWFSRAVGFDGGRARVEWNGRGGAAGRTRAEVKQTALDRLGLVGSVDLLRSLDGLGFRSSRVDEWIDDEGRRATPALARRAVLAGQAVTHARPGQFWHDDEDGRETYYLGRASSDRRARVYDKLEPARTRIELQSRRRAAVWSQIQMVKADSPSRAVVGDVVAFVDFRESRARSDGRRAARLPWWAAVVGDMARAEAAPSRPRPSVEDVAEYLMANWSRKFAEVVDEMPAGWLDEFLSVGRGRLAEENVA
jgi:hypothetical protein